MKLDAKSLALAAAVVTAILWLVCSAAVSLAPGPTMTVTEFMLHTNLSGLSWSLSWGGVLVGLVGWTISAAVAGWLLAWTYNRLAGRVIQERFRITHGDLGDRRCCIYPAIYEIWKGVATSEGS